MKKIFFYIFAIHLFGIALMAIWMPKQIKKAVPIKVNTVVYAPPPPPAQVVKMISTLPPVKKTAPPKPKPKPKPKRVVNKPKPKPKRVARSPAPKPRSKVPDHLLKKLQREIANIDLKQAPYKQLTAPKKISKLQIEEIHEESDSIFAALLVECLQNALDLPAIGKVKVALTLTNGGRFAGMRIQSSENDQNRLFLENELKLLKYPKFTGKLKQEKEHTFVITFCNH